MADSLPILVVGATGILGSEICQRLIQNGHHVRGMVRSTSNPDKIDKLKSLGVEIVVGDLKDSKSLCDAVKGVKVVVSPATSTRCRQAGDNIDTVDRKGQLSLVEAAETEGGIQQFVFVSFPPMPNDFPLQTAKREVEERLKKGRVPYTILQPVNFMEVWFSAFVGFDVSGGKIRLFGEGDKKNFWIATGDVAEFVVKSVGNERVLGKVLPLGGPDKMSQREVAKIFEEYAGKSFTYESLSIEQMKGMLGEDKDEMTRTSGGLMLNCAAGDYVDLTETMKLLPVNRTGVHAYVMHEMGV